MRKLFLVALICAFVAVPVRASVTVNVDFQPPQGNVYAGLGMAADSGTYWNASWGSGTDLVASDGVTATNIDVSTTYLMPYGNPGWGNALLEDRVIWSDFPNFPGTLAYPAITISGLDAGTAYNIYLYAGIYGQTFVIDGVSKSLSGLDYDLDQPDWTEGTQYVSFLGVTAGGLGEIEIYNTAQSNGVWPPNTVVSGMQVQTVPAPGAFLLGSIGAGLIGWLRKGRKL